MIASLKKLLLSFFIYSPLGISEGMSEGTSDGVSEGWSIEQK